MIVKNSTTHIDLDTEILSEKIIKALLPKFNERLNNLAPERQEKYLTRIQASKMLSIGLSTLNEWNKKKILKPMKLGVRTYYSLSAIQEKLNNSNKS